MRKSDGKIEYRSKAKGGSNNTLFSRDELGNSWDFEECVDSWVTYSSGEISASDGILTVERSVSDASFGVQITVNDLISPIIYETLELRIKSTGTPTVLDFFWKDSINNQGSKRLYNSGQIPSEWTTVQFDLTSFTDWSDWKNNIATLIFATSTTSSGS